MLDVKFMPNIVIVTGSKPPMHVVYILYIRTIHETSAQWLKWAE